MNQQDGADGDTAWECTYHGDEKEREWGLHPPCMHIREDGPEEVPLQLRPPHTEKPEDLAEEQSYQREWQRCRG